MARYQSTRSRIAMSNTVSIIVAAADNMAIGIDGGIPWHISEDFRYFKRVTTGHPVIMGSATWRSLGCRCLPLRRNIVVSSKPASAKDIAAGAEFFPSLEAAVEATHSEEETFIIGGGSIYRQAIPIADRIYLTAVHTTIPEADTFFPEPDPEVWTITSCSPLLTDEKSGLQYNFVIYERD